jgi:hypothetical protein
VTACFLRAISSHKFVGITFFLKSGAVKTYVTH